MIRHEIKKAGAFASAFFFVLLNYSGKFILQML